MALFAAGAADGLAVGAATARAFERRVLIKRPGYFVTMNPGAGMVVFSREAAQLVLDHYRTPSTLELRRWYLFACGRDCAEFGEPAFQQGPDADVALASDYQYDMVLQRHGLCTLATSPVLAGDLEPAIARELGGYATPAPAAPDPAAERAVAQLGARLAAQRRAPSSPGCTLSVPSVGARVAFLHQLLFMVDSPARLIGRWRIRWSKFHGPFRFETDDPAAALELPLHGALAALGCWVAPDNAIVEISDGERPAFTLQARAAEPRPVYALATVHAAGAASVRIRAAGAGWLRLFGIGFAAPQPWLPAAPRLDTARLVRCFERQAAQGYIDDVS
jgi:hypothetical protein